ncbi:TPA: hypothetical protein ACH3X2_005198, partial [Trebouxia sp. C0005]
MRGTRSENSTPNAASTKRAHNGVCNFCKHVVAGKVEDFRKHAATCSESNPDAKLAARIQQIRAGGGSASSSQMSIASYTDKHNLSASQNKVMQRLLLLALIMGGVPFAFVANLQFQHFLHCLRPSFVPPGQTMLRGALLDGLHGKILVQHAAWLADEKLAKHL